MAKTMLLGALADVRLIGTFHSDESIAKFRQGEVAPHACTSLEGNLTPPCQRFRHAIAVDNLWTQLWTTACPLLHAICLWPTCDTTAKTCPHNSQIDRLATDTGLDSPLRYGTVTSSPQTDISPSRWFSSKPQMSGVYCVSEAGSTSPELLWHNVQLVLRDRLSEDADFHSWFADIVPVELGNGTLTLARASSLRCAASTTASATCLNRQ